MAEVMISQLARQPASRGLRKCLVTEHRKRPDFAGVCREINGLFPKAKKITLAIDNSPFSSIYNCITK